MRLFVGTFLSPPNQVFYDRFVKHLVSRSSGSLRAIPQGSAHITHAFVGDVDDDGLSEVLRAVAETAASHDARPIALGLPHILFGGAKPRLVCAEVVTGGADVRRLAEDLSASITRARPGVELGPTKAPHVTLARFGRRAARVDARVVSGALSADASADAARVDRVAVVQVIMSRLTQGGPVYEIAGQASLRHA